MHAGRDDASTINESTEPILELAGWRPKIKHDLSTPHGVALQTVDPHGARRLLALTPTISCREGFKATIEWHFTNKHEKDVKAILIDC